MDSITNTQSLAPAVVDSATKQLASKTALLPGFIWLIFRGFHRVHRLWRWYWKAKLYSNPNNFAQLTAGHTLNFVAGDILPIRIAAQCVQIATKILHSVEQKNVLHKAYCKWISAIKGRYPLHVKQKWHSKPSSRILSSSTTLWLHDKGNRVWIRVQRIAFATLQMTKEGFKLSMLMIDSIEAFSFSPESQKESVNELFVNGTKWLDKLADNKEELLDKLKKNEPLITKILDGMHSPYKADQFISHVSSAVNTTAAVYEDVQTVANVGQGVLKDFVKRSIYGFMLTIGMTKSTPNVLVPDDTRAWIAPERNHYGRYPPKEYITKEFVRPTEITMHTEEDLEEALDEQAIFLH